MNRTSKIASLAGAGVLVAAVAGYFIAGQREPAAPGAAAVLLAKPAPTKPFWAARISPLAGTGEDGVVDGPQAQSRFSDPFGVAVDAHGVVYVADGGDSNRIRRIGRDGAVSTFAGGREGFADGAGAAAAFHTPSALAVDRFGNLYVADTGNHAIRKITPQGGVSTLAGDGQPGYADGQGRAARFNAPVGVAVDARGNVYVADTYNDRIRRIAPDGSVSTVAGGARPGNADGPAAGASFDTPSAVAVDKDGNLFVADTGNNALRRIGADGIVSTLAAPLEGERRPLLRRPTGLALTNDGYLYIAGGGGRVLQLAPGGELHALDDADRPPESTFGSDGKVQLYAPHGIAVERDGSLVVADALALRVLRLAPPKAGEPAPALPAPVPAKRSTPMPWPVGPQDMPHEVVGLMGEVRGSYDGESRDHFHAGLDVRADIGSRVLAITATKVSDPHANWGFGSLSEGIAIGPLSYIHMRVGRDTRDKPFDARFQILKDARGKPERVRVPRGTRFAVGDALGSINSMAHVHLDYYPGGSLVNPLTLPFPGVADTIAPRLQGVALYDSIGRRLGAKKGQPVRVARTLGEVSIVADAYDQMDGNLARRRLGLYKLGYQLLRLDGSALPGFEQPRITQVYDRLPREREAVKLLYAENSGITVYGSKATRFAYAVNNTLQGGRVAPGSWQVGALAPGDYILRIYAADYAGQVAVEGRDLAITVE
ncbi:NHL repeat-containing protein [Massilia sp. Leaf139]|uniref:NHL repeat-containing protein n=1 Tax=Massilia sp. Leaf139 TaxID=1736272 RepID=UPI0006FB4632|nr:NHL repeat-containing protein [Massilia sp. Leaf139]KQQ96453.1 gluconolaconase [Massilia sp. Leaf139]